MARHVLDQPALNALRTRHEGFAEGGPLAWRYQPDVAPFVTAVDESAEALAAMGRLVPEGRIAIILQRERSPVPPGCVVERELDGVQMVAEAMTEPDADVPLLPLSEADVPEMMALAALTKPGPFLTCTHLLGGYIGIRDQGRLVAMAGERFKVPGFTEVSAVCTHPDFRGRGYAGQLTRVAAARIAARGEVPFLHTFASNANAIRLYETLGFKLRTVVKVMVLRRA